MNLPVDVTSSNSIVYENQKLNLAAGGRELDFETYYNVKLSGDSQLSLNGLFRREPNNNSTATNETTILAKYKLAF
jgi:hypothetical protein